MVKEHKLLKMIFVKLLKLKNKEQLKKLKFNLC